jgi:hypothetical protein
MDGACSMHIRDKELINVYKNKIGNPEKKGPLRKSRRIWEDNIKIDLREIEWKGVDWFDLAQDRNPLRALVKTVMMSFSLSTKIIILITTPLLLVYVLQT